MPRRRRNSSGTSKAGTTPIAAIPRSDSDHPSTSRELPRSCLVPQTRTVHENGATPSRRPVGPAASIVDRPHPLRESAVRPFPWPTAAASTRRSSRRGDTEHSRRRRDPELGLVRSHEPEDPFGPVSRANQTVAFARISRSSRNRRTSRRRRRNSWRSAVVVPSWRRPSSRSAWATQLRIDCAEGSNSRARWSGLRPDRTRSTICSRYSAGYRFLFLDIVDTSSSKDVVSTKSGQPQ